MNHKPGETFEYSNMNYDILGLIIQKVSHQSYTSYIKEHVLNPLHMHNTTFKTTSKKGNRDASGYEMIDDNVKKTTPEFNIGDTPSAFMMSNTKDLEKLVKMQLKPSTRDQSIIEQSHQAMSKIEGILNTDSYGAGWFINSSEDIIYHTDTLDNFSSIILLNPKQSYGFVILANSNSPQVMNLAENLNSQILNYDYYTTLEQIIVQSKSIIKTMSIATSVGAILFLILSFIRLYKLKHKHIIYDKRRNSLIIFLIVISFYILLSIVFGLLPLFVLGNASWSFVLSWLPLHAQWLLASLYIFIVMITLWISIVILTRHPKI